MNIVTLMCSTEPHWELEATATVYIILLQLASYTLKTLPLHNPNFLYVAHTEALYLCGIC